MVNSFRSLLLTEARNHTLSLKQNKLTKPLFSGFLAHPLMSLFLSTGAAAPHRSYRFFVPRHRKATTTARKNLTRSRLILSPNARRRLRGLSTQLIPSSPSDSPFSVVVDWWPGGCTAPIAPSTFFFLIGSQRRSAG